MHDFKKATFENLIKTIEYRRKLPDIEIELLQKAFLTAQKAHEPQKRSSGEPYFNHVFQTAIKLAEWGLDTSTISAGLLHDTVEDTSYKLEALKKDFGDEIAFLVNGVTKLGHLKYRTSPQTEKERMEQAAENLRKMILAISEDLRVVFIKLADRLHNMKTLGAVPPQKQKRIALETLEIYAPLAYRLGMQGLSGELEDITFMYLHPEEYRWMTEHVKEQYDERVQYLEAVEILLREALKKAGITPVKIDYRAKRISSLYKKLLRANMSLEQIYDLVALRVIVNTIEDCYTALGIEITEIQIRTLQMHEEAENGIAAHWAYSQAKTSKNFMEGNKNVTANQADIAWVQQLRNWQKDFTDPEEFLHSLKIDFFKHRVFAITPKGEVIDLPAGSTPIDFAYQIHSEIGDHCVGAKVNDKMVSLDYQIQSGDLVDILVQKNKKPSESWLQFAKTASAKSKIRTNLKKETSFMRKARQLELRITAADRVGLIKDLSAVISRARVNILNLTHISPAQKTSFPIIKIICDIDNREKTEKLILKLKGVTGVKEIHHQMI
ncbi:MAG: (P)ppGpp synthetase I, SpoT/RelA [Candidatus Wolfebacteria bacterium GW2011_GWA2_47_9b]|uniref:(P)ppGpp synthetase I, SpoT/RelA n=1 Tax=Candidatus Wolfebacteria bacterium GW2011_GWA2_47_9b TaxID=1619005 RepID=A0A0G1U510_9BACT|nr:MAG: (P)ppGpp synthetase I, SpoT/RelA [Candidatus Wolfebacteria bacterium GW2011_GWA2_47_9b]